MKSNQTGNVQKDPNVVSFTKVDLPYGWLGNMAPCRILHEKKSYRTTEALFQCLRFEGHPSVQEEIRSARSPMEAKMKAKKHKALLSPSVGLLEEPDLERMRLCLRLKIQQDPILRVLLLKTGAKRIVEDCSKRASKSGLFWGAKWEEETGEWKGNNALGKLWMELRSELLLAAAAEKTAA